MPAILLISTDRSLDALEQALKKYKDINVFRAASGQETLDLAQDNINNIALMVVDENLSDMSGIDFANKIVQVNPMINCALVSSLSQADYHDASEGLGLLMQLPPKPGPEDADKLTTSLKKVIELNRRSIA